ncbi:MAG: hypothetical protein Q4F03_09305 [Eubacteriales bacterium]|nr:hypothetical protein [Eubacteriales bacterium]
MAIIKVKFKNMIKTYEFNSYEITESENGISVTLSGTEQINFKIHLDKVVSEEKLFEQTQNEIAKQLDNALLLKEIFTIREYYERKYLFIENTAGNENKYSGNLTVTKTV